MTEKIKPVEKLKEVTWQYNRDQDAADLPWGPFELPIRLNIQDAVLSFEQVPGGYRYSRTHHDQQLEKQLFCDQVSLYISPVEPLHLPGRIANHLLIEFKRPAVISPQTKQRVFLTFPLELAVSIGEGGAGAHLVDILTFARQKYSLYGPIKGGLVCKYWHSELYGEIPLLQPLEEGLMQLEIHNDTHNWIEVSQAVFSASGMKIYYGSELVALNARMKVTSDRLAETGFNDHPLQEGLSPATERFSSSLLSIQGKTLMEEGY